VSARPASRMHATGAPRRCGRRATVSSRLFVDAKKPGAACPGIRQTREALSAKVPHPWGVRTNHYRRQRASTRPRRARALTAVSTSVSIGRSAAPNHLYLRAIAHCVVRNHNPRVGGSSPYSGIVLLQVFYGGHLPIGKWICGRSCLHFRALLNFRPNVGARGNEVRLQGCAAVRRYA
jgi:hypothetical protein